MMQQMKADEIKSELCDKIRAEKLSIPGLKEKVAFLEESDPVLYNYIRRLEFIQDGIWCTKCNSIKTIGGKPEQKEDKKEDKKYQLQQDCKNLELTLINLRKALEAVDNNFRSKVKELTDLTNDFDKEMKLLRSKLNGNNQIEQKNEEKNEEKSYPSTRLNETIKKEDLPMPTPLQPLDFDEISDLTADDLLS